MSMLPTSVRAKRLLATAALAAVLCTCALLGPALSAENEQIPNFAPDSVTGWLKPPGDEFLPPASGPGPVKSDPAHPYVSNALARQEVWYGAFVPSGTSGMVVTRLNAEIGNALANPTTRASLLQSAQEPIGGTPASLSDIVREDSAKYERLARELNIKAE